MNPETPDPTLARTRAALKAYDEAALALDRRIDACVSDADWMAAKMALEDLGAAVGEAYGQDTCDRNDPLVCKALVRPGPATPAAGYELSLVRKMVAKAEAEGHI